METMETMKRAEMKMFHDFSIETPKGKQDECVVFLDVPIASMVLVYMLTFGVY